MTLGEVKANLNRYVIYTGLNSRYILSAVIMRKNDFDYFYQAELLDDKNDNSVLIVSLDQIKSNF